MNRTIFLLPGLIAGLGLLPAGWLTAQDFAVLHSFTASPSSPATNSDGGNPYSGLILSGNTLYGAAINGGSSGYGTVFRVRTDGTAFTNLHSFTGGSDGEGPNAGFVLSGNTLYGTAGSGGDSGRGTVFAIHTDGTGFTNLHGFTAGGADSDGGVPNARLILSGNTLYGTAQYGGSANVGTVFAVSTNGTDFTNLHSFTGGNDGAYPYSGLILVGKILYGTASGGGSSGVGTVFAMNTDGTGFTNLHSFAALSGPSTNSDGAYPLAGLVMAGNTLYGTAQSGGSSGAGTVFAVSTDGTGFANLHSFTGLNNRTNSDGASPGGRLILFGNTLYGAAVFGGSSGAGTVFTVNTNGTDFTTLYSFTAVNNSTNSDGAYPWAGLVFSGNTLYGTASAGGSSGMGTVFSLVLPPVPAPRLTILRSGPNVILTWSANAGFTLQSKPASTGAFTNLASATSPYTNPVNSARQFFRLISN